jgi:hypothetical protein
VDKSAALLWISRMKPVEKDLNKRWCLSLIVAAEFQCTATH